MPQLHNYSCLRNTSFLPTPRIPRSYFASCSVVGLCLLLALWLSFGSSQSSQEGGEQPAKFEGAPRAPRGPGAAFLSLFQWLWLESPTALCSSYKVALLSIFQRI